VDNAPQQSLKKENIKFGFRVCEIWPINYVAMTIKFGPNEVFAIVEEEDFKNSNHLDTTMETNNSEDEGKALTKLLNIARIVIVSPTRVECPFSPTPHYYVEMSCRPTTLTTNPKLVVNLKDPYLESNDLNVSYQTQQVLALAYYQQRGLLGRNLK
jgi:hypothetical protein